LLNKYILSIIHTYTYTLYTHYILKQKRYSIAIKQN